MPYMTLQRLLHLKADGVGTSQSIRCVAEQCLRKTILSETFRNFLAWQTDIHPSVDIKSINALTLKKLRLEHTTIPIFVFNFDQYCLSTSVGRIHII